MRFRLICTNPVGRPSRSCRPALRDFMYCRTPGMGWPTQLWVTHFCRSVYGNLFCNNAVFGGPAWHSTKGSCYFSGSVGPHLRTMDKASSRVAQVGEFAGGDLQT